MTGEAFVERVCQVGVPFSRAQTGYRLTSTAVASIKITAAQPTCWIINSRAIKLLADKVVFPQHTRMFNLGKSNAGHLCGIERHSFCLIGQINV